MEENLYVVRVNLGNQTKFEFEGVLLDVDDTHSKFTFGECDQNYAPAINGDVIVLDFNKKSVALNSHNFSMAMHIMGHKKVGDNYHFNCATDLCKVDVYICKKNIWEENGISIFV